MNVRRGELWTVAGGGDFLSKPRPAVIVQSDDYEIEESVTICPLSTTAKSNLALRARIEPSSRNGLIAPSVVNAEMVTTVRQSRLGRRIGRLDPGDMARVEVAVAAFLDLGGGPV